MGPAVTEHGRADAPSVVLLHGLGTTGWMWDRIVPLLREHLHCLVVDLPGHGATRDLPWRSLDDTAATVADLIRTRGHGGTASVAGLSLGGYLAVVLAAQHPDLVPSGLASGVNVLPFPRPRLMRLAGRLMAPVATSGPVLRANARALRVPPEDRDGYLAAARSMAGGTFRAVGAELGAFAVPEAARRSGARMLLTAGEHEHALIRRSLPELAGAFPSAVARVVPGTGHAWPGEQPALFAEALRAHVAGTPLPDRLLAAGPPGGPPAA